MATVQEAFDIPFAKNNKKGIVVGAAITGAMAALDALKQHPCRYIQKFEIREFEPERFALYHLWVNVSK